MSISNCDATEMAVRLVAKCKGHGGPISWTVEFMEILAIIDQQCEYPFLADSEALRDAVIERMKAPNESLLWPLKRHLEEKGKEK
jgi:hypothetical protein